MGLAITVPPKKDAELFVNVKSVNKAWLRRKAKSIGLTMSAYVDALLDNLRKKEKRKK